MENERWLDELRKEFVRRKLPPSYMERLLSELSDHFNDFMEDRMSTDAPDFQSVVRELGSPSDLGAAATAQYRRHRFSGRHPFLIFAVLPIVSLPILFVALLAGVFWMLNVAADVFLPSDFSSDATEPHWLIFACRLAMCAFVILPATGLAWFLCRAARKASLGWKWPLSACVLLAILGGSVFTGCDLAGARERRV